MNATFSIGDRALFNDGQRVTITSIYNGGGAHGCYGVTSDTGARFTAHASELGTVDRPPRPARPLAPGECRTIVRYDTRPARQATPSQQPQGCAAGTTLYGIVRGTEGYRIFWDGRLDDRAYADRADAIRELARRDSTDRQPTPCQQQQGRANAPQYAKPAPCRCDRLAFPHRRDHNCIVHEWDQQAERELADVSRIGPDYERQADAINAQFRRMDYWAGRS